MRMETFLKLGLNAYYFTVFLHLHLPDMSILQKMNIIISYLITCNIFILDFSDSGMGAVCKPNQYFYLLWYTFVYFFFMYYFLANKPSVALGGDLAERHLTDKSTALSGAGADGGGGGGGGA